MSTPKSQLQIGFKLQIFRWRGKLKDPAFSFEIIDRLTTKLLRKNSKEKVEEKIYTNLPLSATVDKLIQMGGQKVRNL